MGDSIQELRESLNSGDSCSVKNAAVELSQTAITDPEWISPAISELQEVVRDGSERARGAAVSALATYGDKVNRDAIETVKDSVYDLLQDDRYNQQNALIAATAIGSSEFADATEELMSVEDTKTTSAATLTYLRVTDSELAWLPISTEHVRCVVSGGSTGLRDEYPEYLLYLFDACYSNWGQVESASENIRHLQDPTVEFAETATRIVNEYPEERITSRHVSALSFIAENHPQTVIESLDFLPDKIQKGKDVRRQYLWTVANAAEADPLVVEEDVIKIARETVKNANSKPAVQAIRILGAVEDTESIPLIEERLKGGHYKLRAAGKEALEKIRSASKESDTVDESSNSGTGDRPRDTRDSGPLQESRGASSGGDSELVSNSSVSEDQEERLANLWEKANAAAREDPVREQVTSSSSQFRRSTPVKEYAKARADGVCECCGDPAPFSDTEGDPYLEVHHVDELGEGGADRPDRVVAVCPTCHRQIHYGADGDEINKRLREQLAAGLGSVGGDLE